MEGKVEEKVLEFPEQCGVYIMKDAFGKVVYVGKAKDLKKRVKSYFTNQSYKVSQMMSIVKDIEYIVTRNEKEALILENTLIKKHKPRYNVYFKDDKNYYSIRIDLCEKYPRLSFVRKIRQDGARYFGPYSSSKGMKESLKFILRLFPLRTCSDSFFKTRKRPCLYYQIKLCPGPCVGLIKEEEYRRNVECVINFLEGRSKSLISLLKENMKKAASELRFEEAARIRDKIKRIEETLATQVAVLPNAIDQDVFALGEKVVSALFIRGGKLIEKALFRIKMDALSPKRTLSSFLEQYYGSGNYIPDEIIVENEPPEKDLLEEWLSEKRKKSVKIISPKRGKRKEILKMAFENVKTHDVDIFERMKKIFNMNQTPRVFEAFDMSQTSGKERVGVKVCFFEETPRKDEYRRYKIKSGAKDDYSMMYEVLKRRFEKGEAFPDVVLVDGGKGQLSILNLVMKELDVKGVFAVSLAKGEKEDKVYILGRKDPVKVPKDILLFLQRIRDEAHRFAITYHRTLREKEALLSIFEGIKGIGEKRKRLLLSRFSDPREIIQAPLDELASLARMNIEVAKRVKEELLKRYGEVQS